MLALRMRFVEGLHNSVTHVHLGVERAIYEISRRVITALRTRRLRWRVRPARPGVEIGQGTFSKFTRHTARSPAAGGQRRRAMAHTSARAATMVEIYEEFCTGTSF